MKVKKTVEKRSPAQATSFLERHCLVIAAGLVLIASVRIALTYTVFNHTSDEPNHIACGLEDLERGTYTFETQHPPLARVAAALGPYLIGAKLQGNIKHDSLDVPIEGSRILSRNHQYDLTLALARLGIMPFFWIACWTVFWWTRRLYGVQTGLMALLLFSLIPPVLAHSGLATTDMPLAAMVGAAFVTGIVWFEAPTVRRAILFGVCCALALISKFSSLPFLPACLVCAIILYFLMERFKPAAAFPAIVRALPTFGLAVLAGVLVTWAGFRFSFGPVNPGGISVPAPELFSGIQAALAHNQRGHLTYLLGRHSMSGFWYYYPVVLGVKTPIALLLLFGFGVYLALRRSTRPSGIWQPLGLVAGVLAVGLYSRINIGVRHVLPVYMGMSVVAAVGAMQLLERYGNRSWAKWVVGALLLWCAGSSLLAHPDYLPYFNELAGSHPENIVVDSDLDWGQDMKRLSRRLHEVGATEVSFFPLLIAGYRTEFQMPPFVAQDPYKPAPGWNAVSMTFWKLLRMRLLGEDGQGHMIVRDPNPHLWPDALPPGERIGKSIMLWNIVPTPAR